MKNFILILITSILLINSQVFSQEQNVNQNYFDNRFGIFLESGLSFLRGDLTSGMKPNFAIHFGPEYYWSLGGSGFMGLKAIGSYYTLRGQTNYKSSLSTITEPHEFRTNLYNAKLGLVLGTDLGSFAPYVAGGVSTDMYFKVSYYSNSDKYSSNKPKFGFFGEGGFKIPLSDAFTFNVCLNYNNTFNDELDNNYSGKNKDAYFGILAGISLGMGGSKADLDQDGVIDDFDMCPNTPPGVQVDEFGCPIDSDKDGVADYLDKCPQTPRGIQVDENGCLLDSDSDGVPDYLDFCPLSPKGYKVDKNGCPIIPPDSDKDGVVDSLDKCPNTPAGVKVDKNGCPIDSDNDGVPDYLDKCPNTPMGVKVDKDGCEIKETKAQVTPLENIVYTIPEAVLFDKGKNVLKASGKEELQKIAKIIKSYGKSTWRIEGHTDDAGTVKGNLKSSYERANIVMKYLISLGVNKSLLTAEGMGRKFPIVPNTTEENKAKNRRIVIIKTK